MIIATHDRLNLLRTWDEIGIEEIEAKSIFDKDLWKVVAYRQGRAVPINLFVGHNEQECIKVVQEIALAIETGAKLFVLPKGNANG